MPAHALAGLLFRRFCRKAPGARRDKHSCLKAVLFAELTFALSFACISMHA